MQITCLNVTMTQNCLPDQFTITTGSHLLHIEKVVQIFIFHKTMLINILYISIFIQLHLVATCAGGHVEL